MTNVKYKKLTGRTGKIASYVSLWMADDHVLLCESTNFLETYKRFYFRDIQGILIRKTNRSLIIAVISSIIVGLCALGSIPPSEGWRIFYGIIGGLFLFIFIVNAIKGPSCVTHIRTGVQNQPIASLNRVKKTDRVLKIIQPLIESAQGQLDAAALDTLSAQAAFQEAKEPGSATKAGIEDQVSKTNIIFFISLIATALAMEADYFFISFTCTLLKSVLSSSVFVLTIVCLVRQKADRIKPSLRILNWSNLVLIFLFGSIEYMILIFSMTTVSRGAVDVNNAEFAMFKAYSLIGPESGSFYKIFFMIEIIAYFGLGMLGLLLSAGPRRTKPQGVA